MPEEGYVLQSRDGAYRWILVIFSPILGRKVVRAPWHLSKTCPSK